MWVASVCERVVDKQGPPLSIATKALSLIHTGRKRKSTVTRDKSGKSRGEPEIVHPETIAVRKRHLRQDGIHMDDYGAIKDTLAGFTLGRLLLRARQNNSDPGSIDQSQFDAGQSWANIVHRHAAIMGYKLNIQTPSFAMVGGGQSCSQEPDEQTVIKIRRQFSDCYNALMAVCRDHGLRVRDVTYGVAVENWPLQRLSESDYGLLRVGLNALAKVLR